MNHRPEGTLSAAGERRREAMLGTLLDEMHALHRRRRTRRRIAGAATLGLVALGVTITVAVLPPATRAPEPSATARAPAVTDDAPAPLIAIVRTDATVLDKYRAQPGQSAVEVLDDRALVTALAAIDRPAGLIRRGDRVWLTAKVTDAELAPQKPSL